jgi:hypothetical protein
MGALWLNQLADVLADAGLNVIEYEGWQSRARSSGGYSDYPLCVMLHHTASPQSWDGSKDAQYIATGDEDAPLANLYIDRGGNVWVIAAGATNTNGKGYAYSFSRGTVPDDRMNEYAIGIEMGNDGVGEAYPQEQIDAMFAATNACNAMCGNTPMDVCTHNEWAPDRKIDPATSFAVQGPWQPGKATSSGTWDLADVQNECVWRAGSTPPPNPDPLPPIPPNPPEDDDEMRLSCYLDENGTIWVGNGINRHALTSMDVFSNYVLLSATGGGSPMYSANGVLVRELGNVATVGQATIEAMGVPI